MDKYTWQETGSSFLPGELIAAFLWAQLEEADRITQRRLASWQRYHDLLKPLEARGILRCPIVPEKCQHNAHMYYVLLSPDLDRQAVLNELGVMKFGQFFTMCRCIHLLPDNGMAECRAHSPLPIRSLSA